MAVQRYSCYRHLRVMYSEPCQRQAALFGRSSTQCSVLDMINLHAYSILYIRNIERTCSIETYIV